VFRLKRAGLPVKLICRLLNFRQHWCPECDTFFLGPKHAKYLGIEESFGTVRNQKAGAKQQHAGSLPH
jgi:hypothetical protein